ncbi:hypothetical protein RF11_10612 [Thelohanellus kitauei]|uniref:Uncharacterized protein n=1 Tax=Thelohanellus kitauei TaxID=669202 RepID=A0A0C2MTP3_THEKT|nr:hypothetical protein RF11_10612 [Thelohanellus kitauei]
MPNELALLNLIDQLFVFVEKFYALNPDQAEPYEHVLDFLNPEINEDFYIKWREYNHALIIKQATKILKKHAIDDKSMKDSTILSSQIISLLVHFLSNFK